MSNIVYILVLLGSTGVSTHSEEESPRKCRERQPLLAYRRQSHIRKAQKDIKITIQNQRRDNFSKLREVFKLIVAYDGPFLQTPDLKKEACLFLRERGLGPNFLDTFDSVGKWEWLENKIWHWRFFF